MTLTTPIFGIKVNPLVPIKVDVEQTAQHIIQMEEPSQAELEAPLLLLAMRSYETGKRGWLA